MVFTYDPTTTEGVVRLLIGDTNTGDADAQIFSDAEITAFLSLEGGVVRLAAASALEAMARSELMLLKVIKIMDVQTDGAAVARELRMQAQNLREQHEQGAGDTGPAFDWAETVLDPESLRDLGLLAVLR